MRKAFVLMAVFCFFLGIGLEAKAADLSRASAFATANTWPGADNAIGGCWVALPNFSSNSPAVMAAADKFQVGLSYTFGLIMFRSGPNTTIHQISASAALPKGVLQITTSNTNSGMAETSMGVDSKLAYSPSLELMYGLQLLESLAIDGDKLFVGAGGSFSTSKSRFSQSGRDVALSHTRDSQVKGGLLYQPMKGLNFGIMYAYSRGSEKSREFQENDDGTTSWDSKKLKSDFHQLRIGMSYQVLPWLLMATDYQYLNASGVGRHQIFFGPEIQIVKDRLYLYTGLANLAPTVGLGIYFKHATLNVSYANNLFDDLNQFYGRSQTIMVTVGGTF